ncbi:hypothetical protein [Aureimonas sp. ME7]|uniref:hypothetical protein n=1 Tax=Aureimonas sp. ME7 TaxID=2744252 RepID=UPI0015F68F8A|nr:hypothetical protein [Aureimonas sp. ME7]
MARHETAPSLRAPRAQFWREARHLVIEGEARVIGRDTRGPAASRAAPAEPVWGSALRAADAAAASMRRPRIALPAGLALFGLAVLLLAPAGPGDGAGHRAEIAHARTVQ